MLQVYRQKSNKNESKCFKANGTLNLEEIPKTIKGFIVEIRASVKQFNDRNKNVKVFIEM